MEKYIKKKSILIALLVALLTVTGYEPAMAIAAAQPAYEYQSIYVHDPRINEKAMVDIVVDPEAVYGFSPDPDSARLGDFASYDWTDPEVVAKAKKDREDYHASFREMFDMWEKMESEGKSPEEIARVVSAMRNEQRLASYKDNPEGLEKVKKSNLETYGNESGPTPEFLFDKYGSWETVIIKSFGSNSGMDACLGLYDEQYEHNKLTDAIAENKTIIYTVQPNDYLIKIAQKYYGDSRKWRKIYNANKNKVGDQYLILIGEKLLIP